MGARWLRIAHQVCISNPKTFATVSFLAANARNPHFPKQSPSSTQNLLQRPHENAKARQGFRPSSKPQKSQGKKPVRGFLRRHLRRILWWYASGSLAYASYIGFRYTPTSEEVPISGRTRSKGLPGFRRFHEAIAQAQQILAKEPHTQDHPAVVERRVREILQRVAHAAGLDDVQFKVRFLPDLEAPQAAISVIGEVFISAGLLKIAQTESQLAAVLAHEVAHHLAGHPREGIKIDHFLFRLSLPLWPVVIPGAAAGGLFVALGTFVGEEALGLLALMPELAVLLIPAAVMISPVAAAAMYSRRTLRRREHEADLIGLYLTAAAGFELDEAVEIMRHLGDFEEKLIQAIQKSRPNAKSDSMLATHPPTSERIERMTQLVPLVRAAVLQQNCGSGENGGHGRDRKVAQQIANSWARFVQQREAKRLAPGEEPREVTGD